MVARNGDAPTLIYSRPIVDRLHALQDVAADHARYAGKESATVLTIRMCVDEIRRAMSEAAETWTSTAETARLTKWSANTLLGYAKTVVEGGTLPHAWRGLEVQNAGTSGYLFRISTVPVKPEKSA